MPNIETIDDAVDALGGNNAVAEMLGVQPNAVSQYKKRGYFPPYTYPILHPALRKRRRPAPLALWGGQPANRFRN
jgi:hypothetical protein